MYTCGYSPRVYTPLTLIAFPLQYNLEAGRNTRRVHILFNEFEFWCWLWYFVRRRRRVWFQIL